MQWTYPTFAEKYGTSLLPCCSFVGYQLHGYSVINSTISFSEEGIYVLHNLFLYR